MEYTIKLKKIGLIYKDKDRRYKPYEPLEIPELEGTIVSADEESLTIQSGGKLYKFFKLTTSILP